MSTVTVEEDRFKNPGKYLVSYNNKIKKEIYLIEIINDLPICITIYLHWVIAFSEYFLTKNLVYLYLFISLTEKQHFYYNNIIVLHAVIHSRN